MSRDRCIQESMVTICSEGEEQIRNSRPCQHKGLSARRAILRRAAQHMHAMVLYNPCQPQSSGYAVHPAPMPAAKLLTRQPSRASNSPAMGKCRSKQG
ncbi:hypothetical protein K503DRAFT_806978 [Rhizopogon vinicolor AM-OR11-026]|uniref:Uncharacterized protein n=1 Tax=Rhizopogon vinicolor AM-OR11-026 TaxID=1314800 RepID=A0A1B7MDE6_9AGAM|nr:hypothetical protein K503DRAFT_806978 [Rhizopogon vinicolor AM-OR11-026]